MMVSSLSYGDKKLLRSREFYHFMNRPTNVQYAIRLLNKFPSLSSDILMWVICYLCRRRYNFETCMVAINYISLGNPSAVAKAMTDHRRCRTYPAFCYVLHDALYNKSYKIGKQNIDSLLSLFTIENIQIAMQYKQPYKYLQDLLCYLDIVEKYNLEKLEHDIAEEKEFSEWGKKLEIEPFEMDEEWRIGNGEFIMENL